LNAKSAIGAERVLLGAVTAAHGIRGEVKVKTFTETPDNLAAYGALTTEDGRRLDVTSLRPTKGDEAVAQFKGIADRNAAESLKGQGLYVAREALPEPEPGEFYLTDLIGLAAEDESGTVLGRVAAVHNFGAGDVLEVKRDNGASEYVPFTDDAVPAVDIAGGRVVIVLPSESGDA
jgi:16S rRNA processing protein RimM